jgi:hypothetical protein
MNSFKVSDFELVGETVLCGFGPNGQTMKFVPVGKTVAKRAVIELEKDR